MQIEDFIEAKVSSVSTSPETEDTILITNPFSSLVYQVSKFLI